MSITRTSQSKWLFDDGYDVWDLGNWLNFFIDRYGVIPDMYRLYTDKSMKDYIWNYNEYLLKIFSQEFWDDVLKSMKEINPDFPEELFKDFHKKCINIITWASKFLTTWDKEEEDKEQYNDADAYAWGEDHLEKLGESLGISMGESLEIECDYKSLIKCQNENREIIQLQRNKNAILLLDYATIQNKKFPCPRWFSKDFSIMVNMPRETVSPIIYYNVSNEYERVILNAVINLFQKVICKKIYESDATVSFVIQQGSEFGTRKMSIVDVINSEENLMLHSNDDFKDVHEDVKAFLNNEDPGLLIFRGLPGSGKTSYIKYLTKLFQDKTFLFISSSIMDSLADPNFISFLTDNKNCVVILEDCEQLLVSRNEGVGWVNSGLMNLLNMTDGILGSAFKFKFICTFNSDNINKIDSALLRKGRCKVNYEFKKLSVDKIEKLVELKKIEDPWRDKTKKSMTVAEIYNVNDKDYTDKTKSIGFC